MLSALLIILIAKIISKPLRNAKMRMFFALIYLDFMLCMPLIRIFIDLIYHINFLNLALALLVAGHRGPSNLEVERYLIGPWLASTLSLVACSALSGSSLLGSLVHRAANFAAIGLAMYFGVVSGEADGKVGRALVLGALILVVASGVAAQTRILAGLDRTSFYWLYRGGETVGFERAASLLGEFAADDKVSYYLKLRGVSVDVAEMAEFALEGEKPRGYLVLYAENLEKGVVAALDVIPLCPEAREALDSMALYYDSGFVYIYGCRDWR